MRVYNRVDIYNAEGANKAVNGERGFYATGQILANYIWGPLGNTVPPFSVKASPSDAKATLTWDTNADVENNADSATGYYKVY